MPIRTSISKPSLTKIANMGWSAGRQALKTHYGQPPDDEEKQLTGALYDLETALREHKGPLMEDDKLVKPIDDLITNMTSLVADMGAELWSLQQWSAGR